jgi:2,3-bisphosphoglycerate-dependent phosphoglycerate mutase
MKLILIRHGLPVRSDTTADAPLADEGHAQAQALAQWLACEPIDALYSSPMRRAVQTAEPLAAARGLPLQLLDGVAEYDRTHGRYIPMEDLKHADPQAWRKIMSGQAVDDLAGFRQTVVQALQGVIASHPGQTVAVACHGGVINVWASHVLGLAEERMFFPPAYTSVHRFMCSSAGHLSLASLNETGHLPRGA